MKLIYLLIISIFTLGLASEVHAQQLSREHKTKLSKLFDRKFRDRLYDASNKFKASQEQNRSSSALNDSIYTFSRLQADDPWSPSLNMYFQFESVGSDTRIDNIRIKILDGSFPFEEMLIEPTYDAQGRLEKMTMSADIGIPVTLFILYYKYDAKGNTTSFVQESPGILGSETTYLGDSVQYFYDGGSDRVAAYSQFTLNEDGVWNYYQGVSDISYAGNNASGFTTYHQGDEPNNPVATPLYRYRNVGWYNGTMPANSFKPLNGENDVEVNFAGVELASADETYKTEGVAYIQEIFTEGAWQDSFTVRKHTQNADQFIISDEYYETGDFIYTSVTEFNYNGAGNLESELVSFDLNFGSLIPLNKVEYNYNAQELLIKAENFQFDQGIWITDGLSEYQYTFEDDQLTQYIEEYTYDTTYQASRTDFFPSLSSAVQSEPVLSENDIQVFPTYVHSELNISFPNHASTQNVGIFVIDQNGKTILHEQHNLIMGGLQVDVSSLITGNYVLIVRLNEGMRSVKFIKN